MKPEFFCCIGAELKDEIAGSLKSSRIFMYRAAESQTIADMLADGFFNDADDLRVNDLILLYCPEQTRSNTFAKVSSISAGVVKTTKLTIDPKDVEDIENAIKQYCDETFVKLDGTSVMTGPLKMAAGSMRGAFSPYLNGVGFFKMDAQNNLTQIATLSDTQFLPATTETMSLGSSAKKFKDFYIGGTGSTINIDGSTMWLKGYLNLRNTNQSNALCWCAGSTSDRYKWALNNDINNKGFQYDSNLRSFMPLVDKAENLGSASFMWKNVYTPKLNNGADIAVPTTGGTMALTSDIAFTSSDVQLTTPSAGEFLRYNGSKWVNSTDAYASTNLNNLTSTGANIGNWSSNVTNCITEIPQDINLTLSSGTLTLAANCKGYKADGTIITNPNILTRTFTTDGQWFVAYENAGYLTMMNVATSISSGTQPANPSNQMGWFDTTNNRVMKYSGSWAEVSFPIAIITVSNGAISSIDQVFNGFGYIGSTMFVLPISVLRPNGRNTDGTLNNVAFTLSTVKIFSRQASYSNYNILLSESDFTSSTGQYYDETTNYVRNSNGAVSYYALLGTVSSSDANGTISEMKTKTVFHAVDYSDSEYIAHCAMPSDRYIDLTLGNSWDTYTMPADGYVCLRKSGNAGEYIKIYNVTSKIGSMGISQTGGFDIPVTVPVSKGDTFQITYTTSGATNYFRFVYANGAK